jgi:hypothetical protein
MVAPHCLSVSPLVAGVDPPVRAAMTTAMPTKKKRAAEIPIADLRNPPLGMGTVAAVAAAAQHRSQRRLPVPEQRSSTTPDSR